MNHVKHGNQVLLAAIILALHTINLSANNFNATWFEMQENYATMCRQLEQNTHVPMRKLLYHPQWQNFSAQIKQLITGKPNPNFLQFPAIAATMVRSGMHVGQSYELCYLTQCISEKTKRTLAAFVEPRICTMPKECTEFNCNANTLGQIYYAARILEQTPPENIRSIIEFGGGYGCLAHIFKSVLPQTTIYIIDIPELLSIQYVYLKSALPNEPIHLHTPNNLKNLHEAGIHLIPTHIMMQLDLQADLFVSNFALSEVTAHVQQMVADKRFFDAHTCYITGQLDGWGDFGFENHHTMHTHIRSRYQHVMCEPFHLILAALKSYELIAQN